MIGLTPTSADAAAECRFDRPPVVLLETGDRHAKGGVLLQYWAIADAPVLWSEASPAGAYADFRAKLTSLAGETDPVRLLVANPSRNNQLVAASASRWIRPASCLERLLQGVQHDRIDTFVAPTEFASFVLRSADGTRLRIYYYTVNQDGIGRVLPVAKLVEQAHLGGWVVLAGLHNHNFHPGRPDLNGPLAPSDPDAQFNLAFARLTGMREAWITNGVHTARIPSADFARFAAEGGD
jgi:hypothetical protein